MSSLTHEPMSAEQERDRVYPGIVPALTVLSMSMALPDQPSSRPLPVLDRASKLSTMVSVELDESSLQAARYDPLSAIVELPAGALSREGLERLKSSREVGFVVWSDQDVIQIGLRSFRVEAYIWKRNSLILGEPRYNERLVHPRQQWLGPVACMEEVPDLKFPQIDNAWEALCTSNKHFVPEDLDEWLVRLRDHELRAWGELLKAAQLDEDALQPEYLEQFDELSSTYRRHAALHHAMMWANRQQLERALDRLDEARMMGRRYDVQEGVMTTRRIEHLGHAWLLRVCMDLAREGEWEQVVDVHDLYPHWTRHQPAWFKRQLAIAMRKQGRASDALELYHEVLPEVRPVWSLYGEYATTYLEVHDAYRARAIQLWARESLPPQVLGSGGDGGGETPGSVSQEAFTFLIRRAEFGGHCVDGTWSGVSCNDLPWPDRGSQPDVFLRHDGLVQVKARWGEPHWSTMFIAMEEEADEGF